MRRVRVQYSTYYGVTFMKRLLGAIGAVSLLAGAATAQADVLTIDLRAGSSTAISSTGSWAPSFNYDLNPLLSGNPTLLDTLGFGANHNFTASAINAGSANPTNPNLGRFNVGLGVCFNFSGPSCDQNSNGTGDDIATGGSPKHKETDGANAAQDEGIRLSLGGAPDEFVYELVSLTFDRIDADGSDDALLKYIDENGDAQSVALDDCTTAQCTVDLNLKGRNFEVWATENNDDWTLRTVQIGLDQPLIAEVVEPHALALAGIGLLGLGAIRRRRRA